MNGRQVAEAVILMSVSAVLYGLGCEMQVWIFQFAEHLSGVHWFYLPAGLRVLLVLVAGIYGALGIFAATVAINLWHLPHLNGPEVALTAVASGFSAWIALWLMRLMGSISESLSGLTSAALLQFAILYSATNAILHQCVRWSFKHDDALLVVDIWPMFVGDLLGAIVFLYVLKLVLVARKPKPRTFGV